MKVNRHGIEVLVSNVTRTAALANQKRKDMANATNANNSYFRMTKGAYLTQHNQGERSYGR